MPESDIEKAEEEIETIIRHLKSEKRAAISDLDEFYNCQNITEMQDPENNNKKCNNVPECSKCYSWTRPSIMQPYMHHIIQETEVE